MLNSTLLVASTGSVVEGPPLRIAKADPCAAVINRDAKGVTVVVLGGAEQNVPGGSTHSSFDMEVFRQATHLLCIIFDHIHSSLDKATPGGQCMLFQQREPNAICWRLK